MTDHDDATPDVPPIESWGNRDEPPPVDALAAWDFEPEPPWCDSQGCHEPATRVLAYRHGAKPEGCTVPTAELLCQDHVNAVRKAAKVRADAERMCRHCKETPRDYFDVVVRDELL